MSQDHLLVETLVASGRWSAALDALGPAMAAAPQDPRLVALLLRTLRGLGRHGEAVGVARTLLTMTPDDPYAMRLATLALLDVGWVDEAIGVATRAVAADPENARNHLALSRAWGASRRPEALTRQLGAARAALALEPSSVDAHIQAGVALAGDGQVGAARRAYREALSLDPSNSAALNNLAVLDVQGGAPRRASRHLAAALAADPHDAIARRNLDAVALLVLGRMGWWMMLAPLAGLLAAAAGHPALARAGAAVALLATPLLALRWWLALSTGQRRHLRTLGSRVRPMTWVWPLGAAILGGAAVAWVIVAPSAVTGMLLVTYAAIIMSVSLMRLFAAMSRRSWPAKVAARSERLRLAPRR